MQATVIYITVTLGIALVFVFCLWKYCHFKLKPLKPEDGMALYSNRSRSSSASYSRKTSVEFLRSRSRSPDEAKSASVANNHQMMTTKEPPLPPPEPNFVATIAPAAPYSANVLPCPPKPPPLEYRYSTTLDIELSQSQPLMTTHPYPTVETQPASINNATYLLNMELSEPKSRTRTRTSLPESVVLINEGVINNSATLHPVTTNSLFPVDFYSPQELPPPTYSQTLYGSHSPTAPDVSKEEFTEYQSYR